MEKENRQIKITLEESNDIPQLTVATVMGHVDSYNSKYFQDTIINHIQSGSKNIIMDCSGLNYLSSAGIGSFVAIAEEMKDSGMLIMYRIQPKVYEVFSLLGFINFFNICSSYEDAIEKSKELLNKSTAPELDNLEEKIIFPFVFQCNVCSKKLRTSRPGQFACPQCQSVIAIDKNGKISYP